MGKHIFLYGVLTCGEHKGRKNFPAFEYGNRWLVKCGNKLFQKILHRLGFLLPGLTRILGLGNFSGYGFWLDGF